jgi:hypothetical protein
VQERVDLPQPGCLIVRNRLCHISEITHESVGVIGRLELYLDGDRANIFFAGRSIVVQDSRFYQTSQSLQVDFLAFLRGRDRDEKKGTCFSLAGLQRQQTLGREPY